MAEFDFRPTYDRNGGISAGDRAAANMTPLAAIAGAAPAVLEALRRRQQLIERNAAIDAVSQGLGSDAGLNQQQMAQGMKTGLFDAKGLMDVMSTADLRKQQAEKAKQEAEFKKWMMNNGVIPVYDQQTGQMRYEKVKDNSGPARPTVVDKPEPVPEIIQMMRQLGIQAPGATPSIESGGVQGTATTPVGASQPKPPQAPEGFETVRNKTTGAYGFRNLKNGKIIAAPQK